MEIMSYRQQNMNGYKKPTNDHEFIIFDHSWAFTDIHAPTKKLLFLDGLGAVDIFFLDLDDVAVAGKGLHVKLLEVADNHQLIGLILDVLAVERLNIGLSQSGQLLDQWRL